MIPITPRDRENCGRRENLRFRPSRIFANGLTPALPCASDIADTYNLGRIWYASDVTGRVRQQSPLERDPARTKHDVDQGGRVPVD